MDHHTFNGVFLGYTASNKNVYYVNNNTHRVKIGTHATFDDAHFTAPYSKTSLAAQKLQILGYNRPRDVFNNGNMDTKNKVEIAASSNTKQPRITSKDSGILKIFSPTSIRIKPGSSQNIDTGISVKLPQEFCILVCNAFQHQPISNL